MYAIREDTLEITSYLFGRKREAVIPLRSISPDYELRGTRALRAVVLLLVPVAVCIVAYRWLLHRPDLPDMLRDYPLYFGALFAFAAFRLYPRFETFVFKNHFGRPLFTILREAGQRAECEAFIRALLDRIDPSEGSEGTAVATLWPPADDAETHEREISMWILALGLAGVSVIVPPIVNFFWPDWDGMLIPLVVVCSGGAVVAAFYSFGRKEPRRWWSVLAVVLAVVPVLFY